MFKDLPTSIKISITRSITVAFERYMKQIQWNEEKFRIEDFIAEWRKYITESSAWYKKLDDKIKADPVFHEELAAKINETIDKLLSDEPTEAQIAQIEQLEKRLGKEFNISCKTEAKYILENVSE